MAKSMLLVVLVAALLALEASASFNSTGLPRDCASTRLYRVKNRQDPVRGANLGSWLIQEAWMVGWLWNQGGCDPNQYPGAYLLEQCLGGNAYTVISKHWATFVQESDFALMAQNNLNTVRLPVGWWQIYDPQGGASKAQLKQYVNPTNYLVGGLQYIDQAFAWGAKYGISILLDIHAAPGSQSGNQDTAPPDNTGNIYWDKYAANPAQTADSIELYAQRYANEPALLGFCLLNEPGHQTSSGNINIGTIQAYYQDAYNRIRQYTSSAWVVINPLISPFQYGTEPEWTSFMNPDQGYTNVFMSIHYYHCFGGMPSGDDNVINYAHYQRQQQIAQYYQVNPKPMLIDEWSACGVSPGRYGDMIQAQVAGFGQAAGWVFWAWSQTWGGDPWSFKTAFQNGWITPSQTGVASC